MPHGLKLELVGAAMLMLIPFFVLLAGTLPQVISIQPAAHSTTPVLSPEIVIRFDAPIDPTSIVARSFSVFGRWTGVCPGQYAFEDGNQQIRFTPARAFSAGEWITVSLSKNVKSASGESMAKGYAWNFMTAAQPGSFEMAESKRLPVRRAGEGPIRTYGAYAGDLNADGFHDFTMPNEEANDIRVFLNDGAGSYSTDFNIFALPVNSTPSTNEGADFNGDGLLDFAVGNIRGGNAGVFLGDGQGGFAAAQVYATGAGTRGLGVLDLNGDGTPDLVTANRSASNVTSLLNRGDGSFAPRVILDSGVQGETSCVIADANEDGVMDVFVGGYDSDEIAVLLGDGNGNLSFSTKVSCQGDAWMIAAGDVDGDHHVDVVSANAGQRTFSVLRGNGAGQLGVAQVFNTGIFSLAIDLGDLDGDGDLDLATSNYSSRDFILYENDGAGQFTERKKLFATVAASCAVLHDRDRDGDLDMTGIDEEADLLFLFENPGTGNRVDQPLALMPPGDFELLQSYPNPFVAGLPQDQQHAGRIVIPFVLRQAAEVRLEIVNLRGEVMTVLLHGPRPAGMHRTEFSFRNLTAGVYFYRLRAGGLSTTRKLLVLHR